MRTWLHRRRRLRRWLCRFGLHDLWSGVDVAYPYGAVVVMCASCHTVTVVVSGRVAPRSQPTEGLRAAALG